MGIASCSIIALLSFFYSLWEVRALKTKIAAAKKCHRKTEEEKMRRKNVLHADLWTPPNTFQCVNQTEGTLRFSIQMCYCSYLIYNTIFPTGMNNTEQALSAKVLHQYKPQTKEELCIYPGDIISEVVMLEQGWCRVSFHHATQQWIVSPCMLFSLIDRES